MKKLALLASFFAFNAFAGNAKLTVTFENYDIAKMNKAYVVFESTSPFCKKPVLTGGGPAIYGKSKSYNLPIKKLNKNTVSVETSTIDPNNDLCGYKFSRITLSSSEIYWIGLSSTSEADYSEDDAPLDVLKNPKAELEAVCRKGQCQKTVDGRAAGYKSNAMVIYADKKLIDKNVNIDAKLKVIVE